MGYNLYITRAKWYHQNDGQWITTAEWLRYVERDPELRLAGYNGEYFALWSGKSQYPDPWLNWSRGNIYSKSPDDAIIKKMVAIAKDLSARVQGDDGEVYTGDGHENQLRAPEATDKGPGVE
jgi:hypothetical protein